MLYRIHWRADRTDATGHGTGAYPYQEAKRYTDAMNVDNKGILTHWVEPVPPEEMNAAAASHQTDDGGGRSATTEYVPKSNDV